MAAPNAEDVFGVKGSKKPCRACVDFKSFAKGKGMDFGKMKKVEVIASGTF